LTSAFGILKEIEATSGKNDKIEIIKKNSDNEEFKAYLRFLYDDMIVTGLSAKKIDKDVNEQFDTYFDNPIEVMNYLKANNTGRDIDVANVQNFINSFAHAEYEKFLKEVFTKSYKCGITAASVNKALGNDFIKEFKVQLAHPFEKYESKIKSKFYLTQKFDGHRTLIRVNMAEDKVTFWTRKGHEIRGLVEIEQDIRELIFPLLEDTADIVFDGEITVINDHEVDDVFSATSKIITKKSESKTGLKFNVFDVVTYEEFMAGKSKLVYEDRRVVLDVIFMYGALLEAAYPYFVLTPILYAGDNVSQIAKWSNWATENGHEGVMLNTADGIYQTKRTPDLLKVKKFHNADVLCTGVFVGTGKYEGTLGGITIDYKGNEVSVGSGFTDAERYHYWRNQDEIIGKIVDVQFFEETTNQKDDGISLRFPTFKSVRDDKSIEDINVD